VLNLLAESEIDLTAAKWYWSVTLIMVIGAAAVFLIVVLAVSRRWARRQHTAIEKDKAARREMRSSERVDTWRASADRYVDRDKLPDPMPGEASEAGDLPEDDELDPPDHGPESYQDKEEDRDPYGLFESMPFEESDDDDDDDDEEDLDEDDDGEDFDEDSAGFDPDEDDFEDDDDGVK